MNKTQPQATKLIVPLQGFTVYKFANSQGVALGYHILPFQGVTSINQRTIHKALCASRGTLFFPTTQNSIPAFTRVALK
ncbi:MAG: hypothetical protein HZA50_07050 [Planctomycetes bacterium]|nr:hypothetical protein [Planctomycetota bacterium]